MTTLDTREYRGHTFRIRNEGEADMTVEVYLNEVRLGRSASIHGAKDIVDHRLRPNEPKRSE